MFPDFLFDAMVSGLQSLSREGNTQQSQRLVDSVISIFIFQTELQDSELVYEGVDCVASYYSFQLAPYCPQ